ncbi:hypothetical protein PAAG_07686 [Paracoccidioides lutzii Pb01]|uniref:Uncharacterized protein n=1 Tax=Paracoccidioides lutzii (strain ATCC MYA-826 / Pb01) TaxID=502779 RepID=C1HAN2_PARBA|nr:hypothetical protein PAAG_07686 [Paracoccidioides lutzii Pb01]EEH37405.2 hypothetical protein PAAG_07686 [Paracoccidioides lutzii Pb01]
MAMGEPQGEAHLGATLEPADDVGDWLGHSTKANERTAPFQGLEPNFQEPVRASSQWRRGPVRLWAKP